VGWNWGGIVWYYPVGYVAKIIMFDAWFVVVGVVFIILLI